jgi:hypothetical protein
LRKTLCPLLSLLLTAQASATPFAARAQNAVKNVQSSDAAAQILTNREVLQMFAARLAPEVIVEKLRASRCDFDTTPDALQKLREAGLPDSLLLVMVLAPKCGCSATPEQPPPPRKTNVRVPSGTHVELETAYTINSQLVRRGDAVSFRVVNPVIVDGAVVVAPGAIATALVTKAERGGHFGRAGRITWMMKEVTAVDGSRLPLQFSGHVVGDSHGAKVATQMAVTGALLWPIAPVVLFHGFKRGENAVVPEGKRFDAIVQSDATVSAPTQ